MSLKTVKESLPWVVPSVALIVVGTQFLDRGNEGGFIPQSETPAQVAALPAAVQTSGQSEKAQALTAAEDPYKTVATLPTTPEQQGSANAQAVSFSPEQSMAALEAPKPAPVKPAQPDTRQAALGSTEGAAEFFANAQANLASQTSCKEDLKALAAQTRVYFPSGGLTADANGIELARLIGTVAETCPGVRIEVQGHSDPSGDPVVNRKLSAARAEQVIQRLGGAGVDTSIFIAKGYGDARPSTVQGPESRAYYDRRVEFAIIEDGVTPSRVTTTLAATPDFELPRCVKALQAAVDSTKLFYGSRSISVLPKELEIALDLAQQAQACPQARLRVIGHHSGDVQDGETIHTGMLRAKALMSMLVSRGVDSQQVIIAAPSRSGGTNPQPGLSNSRIDFDVIFEGG